MKQRLRQLHEHTDNLTRSTGMVWHRIFGPKEVKQAVPAIKNYSTTFRLVGGSVKLGGNEAWTPLEQDRCDRWEQAATTVQHLPVGWFTKVKILRSIMPKLTVGQGTQGMQDYSLSPQAVFAIIAPPSLEPAYALQCSAFQLVQRVYNSATKRRLLSQTLAQVRPSDVPADGPLARVVQLQSSSGLWFLHEGFPAWSTMCKIMAS